MEEARLRMKCLVGFFAMSSLIVFGAPVVRTGLPLSPFADTEISTNIAFAAYGPRQRRFTYELAFDAAPSNNFEVAFGRDGDGNGILSRDEADFTVGWDCGEWFARVALVRVGTNGQT